MEERRWLFEGVERPDADAMDVYRRGGGYDGAWRAFDEIDAPALIDLVEAAGLRGRGGSWRPVAGRWRRAVEEGGAAVVCVDLTEAEPGRFRDRKLAERLPHRIVEGALIAARAVGAGTIYLCVRADWGRVRSGLAHALEEARAAGWIERPLGRSRHAVRCHLHPVPGGVPSFAGDHLLPSLIESGRPAPRASDGRRGLPTMCGRPVLVHTAATLGYLPAIVARGAEAFRQLGTGPFPGTVSLSISGHVRRPGLYEIEIGSGSFGDVVDACAGGVVDDQAPTAVFPAGAPPLRGSDLWAAPVDPGAWSDPGGGERRGAFGTGTLVIAGDSADTIDVAAGWMKEGMGAGCGQCPSCREGLAWLAQRLSRLRTGGEDDVDLEEVGRRLQDLSRSRAEGLAICGHAAAVAAVAAGLLALEPERTAAQARAGAGSCPAEDRLRTPDSIHLRF